MILPRETTTPRHAVFYFDFGDPYSYVAAGRIQRLCRELGVSLAMEPVNASALGQGGAVANDEFWPRVARAAAVEGLTLRVPDRYPFDSTLLLKTCLFVRDRSGQEAMSAVADRLWQEIWQQGADPTDIATAVRVAQSVAIPGLALTTGLASPRVDQMLVRVTERARERGVRVAPTVQVEADFFPGIDALPAAEVRLRGERAPSRGSHDGPAGSPPTVPDWTFSG